MAAGGRSQTRSRILRRALLLFAGLVLLTLILAASGHWILAAIVGVAAVVAGWLYAQARSVR